MWLDFRKIVLNLLHTADEGSDKIDIEKFKY